MDESRGEFLMARSGRPGYKDRIATQVLFLNRNPHVSICGSFTETLVQQAGIPSRVRLEVFPKSHRQIRTAMVFLNPMACNTVTMRLKDFRERSFRFRPEFGNSLDYDMWSQASDVCCFRTFHALQVLIAYTRTRHHEVRLLNDASARHPVQVELIERSLRIPVSAAERTLPRAQQLRHSTFRRLMETDHRSHFDRPTSAIKLSMLNPLTKHWCANGPHACLQLVQPWTRLHCARSP